MRDERARGRVLQLVNTLAVDDGGPARNAYELNLALNAHHQDVDLVWIKGRIDRSVVTHADMSRRTNPGPRRLSLRSSQSAAQVGLASFSRELSRSRLLIIHGVYLWWIPILLIGCRVLRVPVLLMPHGALTTYQRTRSSKQKRLFHTVVDPLVRSVVRAAVVGSHIEREQLPPNLLTDVRVAGVGTCLYEPPRLQKVYGRPLELLSIARISTKKRHDLMIDCVRQLMNAAVDVRLRIFGTGDPGLVRSLRAQCVDAGVQNQIEFVGPVDGAAKHEAYHSSDLFLMPSDDENFGIALAEALAHGLPVIASDRVAAANALSPTSGSVVANPTGERLARAVREFVSTTGRGEAAESALSDARTKLSWDGPAHVWRQAIEAYAR